MVYLGINCDTEFTNLENLFCQTERLQRIRSEVCVSRENFGISVNLVIYNYLIDAN